MPLFLLSLLFMVASLAFEAVFGVHFVTAVMGLDWHRWADANFRHSLGAHKSTQQIWKV